MLDDFVRLFTLHKRIRPAWNGGTPNVRQSRGLTDMLISPEITEEFRRMAYNPLNTRAGPTSATGTPAGSTVGIPLTESQRESIFNNAGIPEFYGVAMHEIQELGIGYKYNDLFDYWAGSIEYPDHGEAYDSTTTSTFTAASEEIMLGLDLSENGNFVRPVVIDKDTNAEFTVEPDDQFTRRSGKIGFYGSLEEGRLILDDKGLSGLIV